MKEGLKTPTYEPVLKEFQTIISVGYLLSVGIGMLFNYQKYAEFGINIFDYADVFDFLIAPFSDLYILLFTGISLFISYLFFLVDVSWSRKYPKSYSIMTFGLAKKRWFILFRYISFGLLIIYYLYISADIYGRWATQKIKAQAPISLRFSDNETKQGIMIGKTKEIIFLMSEGKVKAIPITALIKEFEIK